MNTIILLGPPGSGKGTQADKLSVELKIPIFSPGKLLRQEIKQQTALGQDVKPFVESGDLIPNHLIRFLFKDFTKKADLNILDGFPRNTLQLKIFNSARFLKVLVIVLDLNIEAAKKRLLNRKRRDDDIEVVRKRFEVFDRETIPMLKTFRDAIRFDASLPIEVVYKKIKDKITKTFTIS